MVKLREQQPSPQQSHTEQVPAALIEEEDEEGAAGDPPDHTPTTGPSLSQMGIETATHEPGINPGTPAGEEKLSEAVQEKEMVSDVKEINFPPPSDGASPDIQEQKGLTTAELEMTAPEETKEMEKTTSPLPTSMTFSEGEKEEPLTIIGEDLARDDDPAKEEFSNGPPILELGTPERQATPINEEKIDDEVEDEQATFERMEMEYKYQALFVERQTLRNHNNQIQNKLADYYRKKMTEESKAELKKAHSDYEQRYVKFMDSLAKLQAMYREEVESYQEQIADLSAQCEEKQQLTEYAWRMFTSRKRSVAKTIINKRPGRHAALLELERIQNIEEQKEKEMRQIRFLTIKMKNKLKYYEYQLKAKEELAGGLNLIDYEQLKIENQSYGEKIEERNEEVTKMRKKIAVTVGIMTHIKEKLEYVEAENVEKKNQLMDLEAVVAQKREILTKTKQARDRVRAANFKLKEKCGLLCNKVLLRDYEDNVDTSDRLRQKLEVLKRQHADLTLDSYGIKKKIEWVKMGQLQTQ